jgi:hypothetical protein
MRADFFFIFDYFLKNIHNYIPRHFGFILDPGGRRRDPLHQGCRGNTSASVNGLMPFMETSSLKRPPPLMISTKQKTKKNVLQLLGIEPMTLCLALHVSAIALHSHLHQYIICYFLYHIS